MNNLLDSLWCGHVATFTLTRVWESHNVCCMPVCVLQMALNNTISENRARIVVATQARHRLCAVINTL